jgi:UDP-N-acetylmuramate--alanine ligase
MATHITPVDGGISFKLNGEWATLPMIGTHNIANALAAIGVALHAGISIADSLMALNTFKGTKRRLQKIGETNNITIYDDYAHNPEKMRAALSALKPYGGRIFAIYQPHGFAPMRLMKDEFIQVLEEVMDDNLTLIMPDIYYVGGTVAKDISSEDVINPLATMGKKALYIPSRTDILTYLAGHVQSGDKIVVMGARDDSLSDFAQEIFKTIQGA